MKSVADFVNAKIKEFEHILRMNEIDYMINYTMELKDQDPSTRDPLINPFFVPTRTFKHQVDQCKISINGDAMPLPNEQSTFVLYIFNDILLWFRKLVLTEPETSSSSDKSNKKDTGTTILTEYCGVIHLEAEKLPYIYLNVISDDRPHTSFMLVTEGKGFTIELPNEDEVLKTLKILVDGMEEIYKIRKRTTRNIPRPQLPFMKPVFSDPFTLISGNVGNQLQRVSSLGTESPRPTTTSRTSLSNIFSRKRSSSNGTKKSQEKDRRTSVGSTTGRVKSLTFEPIDAPKKRLNPYFLDREDFPSRVIEVESLGDADRLSISQQELEALKKKPDDQCIGMCFATMNFVVEDQSKLAPDEITFRKGDLFLVYEKVGGLETSWLKVKKMGLNCDAACKELLQNERKYRVHGDLVKEMKTQRSKKKVDASKERQNDKILRRMTSEQFIMIDERQWDELIAPDEKLLSTYLNFSGLDQYNGSSSYPPETPTTPSTESTNLLGDPHKKILKSRSMSSLKLAAEKLKLAKSSSDDKKIMPTNVPVQTSLSPAQEEQLINRLVNIFKENGVTGLIPVNFVQELSPTLQKKLLGVLDVRNYDEDRKIRNFVRPSTLTASKMDLRASLRNSKKYE
jgi:hypothetical protein